MSEQELELPKGWTNSSLDSLSILITKGSTPTTYGYDYLEKGINFVRVENIIDGQINKNSLKQFISKDAYDYLKRSQLKENDILFSIAGTIGRTTIVTKEDLPANTNQAIALIRCPWEYLETKFIKTILNSPILFNSFSKNRRGVGMDNVGLGDIKEIIVPLPPLNEQKKIVSKIEELFSKIDSTKQLLEQIKMQLRIYDYSFQKKIFDELSKKYPLKELVKVCTKINDGTHHSPENGSQGDVPYITAKNIRPRKIDLSNITYVSKESHKEIFTRCNPVKGDVLYTKDGTVGYAVVNNLDFDFSLLSSVALLKPNHEIINSYYLETFLNNPVNYNNVTKKMTGSALRRIILAIIKKLLIPLPPIDEQKKITFEIQQNLSLVENTTQIVNSTLQTLQTMKISVLKRAFEGKLVQQDPNDEPAHILLEKIKNTKEAKPTKKRRAKNVK